MGIYVYSCSFCCFFFFVVYFIRFIKYSNCPSAGMGFNRAAGWKIKQQTSAPPGTAVSENVVRHASVNSPQTVYMSNFSYVYIFEYYRRPPKVYLCKCMIILYIYRYCRYIRRLIRTMITICNTMILLYTTTTPHSHSYYSYIIIISHYYYYYTTTLV